MKLFAALNEELKQTLNGVYAPYYYRHLGFRKDLAASYVTLRANGIRSLFAESKPVILKNELLAGNRCSLYTEAREVELRYAKGLVDMIAERNFSSNRDHYAPDYDRILARGVTGLLADIEASKKNHCDEPSKIETLEGMKTTLEAFLTMIEGYAKAAEALMGAEGYDDKRLEFIAANCRSLLSGAPETFP